MPAAASSLIASARNLIHELGTSHVWTLQATSVELFTGVSRVGMRRPEWCATRLGGDAPEPPCTAPYATEQWLSASHNSLHPKTRNLRSPTHGRGY